MPTRSSRGRARVAGIDGKGLTQRAVRADEHIESVLVDGFDFDDNKAADPGDPRLIVGCTLSSALFAVARPHRASTLCFHTASADSGLRAGRLAAVIRVTESVLRRTFVIPYAHADSILLAAFVVSNRRIRNFTSTVAVLWTSAIRHGGIPRRR